VANDSIHSICGENGAGKSTLMKVLSGVYPHGTYDGKILFNGKEMKFRNIKESEQAGIAIIHQELTMIPELSITENIFMGNELTNRGLIDWHEERRKTVDILKKVGLSINPDTLIKHLGVGQQQLVEIAKALSKNVKLLILDEPTSALNEDDSENLLNLMRELKSRGITCIMISHKLNEIAAISDAVTVIRDGQTVDSYEVIAGQVDEDKIIRSMVGRSIENRYPEHESKPGDIIFEVKDWCVEDPEVPGRMVCKNSTFNVRAGEIVGFAGLMGAGRTELMRSIFGHNYGVFKGGSMKIMGREVRLNSVEDAIKNGIAYVPEDRKSLGLNLLDSIRKTIVAADLKKITKGGLLDPDEELRASEEYRKALRIKTKDVDVGVSTLSGGNQQKVILARWLATNPQLLMLDEPTRGIDIGTKAEIQKIVIDLAAQGMAVLFISSELDEELRCCRRIVVLKDMEKAGEVVGDNISETAVMQIMAGGEK
jgi:putative multiple sugar transport system ATP-binding protein